MNIKLVALTSLLAGTALAIEATKKQPTQVLAELIQTEYNARKNTFTEWRHMQAHHFDYLEMKDEPFCSLNQRKLSEEAFDTYVKALRSKTAEKTEAVAFKNAQLKEKIDHIMMHLKAVEDMVVKYLNSSELNDKGELLQMFQEQIFALKIGLSAYDAKSKNFKEVRSVMDALKGIFHFNLKSDEFIRIVVDGLKSGQFKKSAEKLHTALEKVNIKVTDEDYSGCLDKIKAAFSKDEKGLKEMEICKKTIISPFILSALKSAHNKTSSSIVLGTFVAASILSAFVLLALKHMSLVKKEREEFTD